MTSNINALLAELQSRCVGAWPDCAASGVFEADQLQTIQLESLTPPYAAVVLGQITRSEEFGTVGDVYEATAELAYIGAQMVPSTARTRAQAMVTDLYGTDLTYGRVIEVAALNMDPDSTINQVLIGRGAEMRAATVLVRLIVGAS